MIAGLLSLLLIAAPAPGAAQDRRPPIDQCASDPSFAAFRSGLLQAIERRDAGHVLSVIADDIAVDFGGGAGRGDFIRTWSLDAPAASGLWAELGTVLSLGCARDGEGLMWAPSLYRQLDDQEDPFTAVIAVRPGAALHAAPDPQSPAVAALEWDVLTLESDDGEDEWLAVRTADGRAGFVRRGDVRSPIDYRAGFDKVDGRWRMIAFIAGD